MLQLHASHPRFAPTLAPRARSVPDRPAPHVGAIFRNATCVARPDPLVPLASALPFPRQVRPTRKADAASSRSRSLWLSLSRYQAGPARQFLLSRVAQRPHPILAEDFAALFHIGHARPGHAAAL